MQKRMSGSFFAELNYYGVYYTFAYVIVGVDFYPLHLYRLQDKMYLFIDTNTEQ